MKVRHTERPLPSCFSAHPRAKNIILERDIRVTKRGKIKAKLLVFSTKRDLHVYWRDVLDSKVSRYTAGAVQQLFVHSTKFTRGGEEHTLRVDPTYFCVIGLSADDLVMEYICHEAVHAGYAYARRRKGSPWAGAKEMDEENVAYPAGIIAKAVNRHLHKANLYKP